MTWQRLHGNHYITISLHHCNIAPLHHCITASLHHCNTAPLHHCTTASLHHCTTSSLHHCIIAPLHHCSSHLINSAAPSTAMRRTIALHSLRDMTWHDITSHEARKWCRMFTVQIEPEYAEPSRAEHPPRSSEWVRGWEGERVREWEGEKVREWSGYVASNAWRIFIVKRIEWVRESGWGWGFWLVELLGSGSYCPR